jgi:hypothetical protein
LKLYMRHCIQRKAGSPPSRRRGLKLYLLSGEHFITPVASLAEAWVETGRKWSCGPGLTVASLAEAWVETCRFCQDGQLDHVASLAEAWVETSATVVGLASMALHYISRTEHLERMVKAASDLVWRVLRCCPPVSPRTCRRNARDCEKCIRDYLDTKAKEGEGK